jgi:pYEATS domain-containing protein involved in immunity/TIR domain-containing protein
MSLGIHQAASYAGDGYWKWSVWIDGPDAELDQVQSVEWVLHPTFPNPIVVANQRQNKFGINSSGWGAFEINAHVSTEGGRTQHLKHWLRLDAPGGSSAEPPRTAKPAAFISAGIKDALWEEAVRAALARRSFDVFTSSDVPGDAPAETAISSTLDKADLVVGIFSDTSGPWVDREVMKAMEKDVSVVPLLVGSRAKLPSHLDSRQAVYVTELADVDAAIGRIVDWLG